MADPRRTRRRPPRGGGHGRTARTVRGGRAGRPANPANPAGPAGGPQRRPRVTGRAVVLVLVLAVLAVSYASSLRAYLQQRDQIRSLKADIARSERSIEQLEVEKRRWQDPAFVEQQARERLGYVGPGERAYIVLDEDGAPLESEASLRDPAEVLADDPVPWWSDVWSSVELAGDPPKAPPPPATSIDGSAEGSGE